MTIIKTRTNWADSYCVNSKSCTDMELLTEYEDITHYKFIYRSSVWSPLVTVEMSQRHSNSFYTDKDNDGKKRGMAFWLPTWAKDFSLLESCRPVLRPTNLFVEYQGLLPTASSDRDGKLTSIEIKNEYSRNSSPFISLHSVYRAKFVSGNLPFPDFCDSGKLPAATGTESQWWYCTMIFQ